MANSMQQLTAAIAENKVDDVKSLIAAGVDVNHSTAEGFTFLGLALRGRNAELVRLLLDAGASPHAIAAPDEMAPVHLVVRQNRVDLLALLIEAGADPDIPRGKVKYTVLMHAAYIGNLAMVELCLAHGCDVYKTDCEGSHVLEYARGRPEDVALWQRLLDAGADPQGGGSKYRTPLHHAARGASADIVKLLLAAGASVGSLDKNRSNAITTAVRYGDPCGPGPRNDLWIEVVRALVEAGVDVTHTDDYNMSALEHAIFNLSDKQGWHGGDCEASKKVIALIQAELDRRKAAALSVLRRHTPPEVGRLVLDLALLVDPDYENPNYPGKIQKSGSGS